MKTVILCGGRGTRLGRHGESVPKAMLDVGGDPIIRHILGIYSHYGINDFVLCLGHLREKIEEYFATDEARSQDWNVSLRDTGAETNTGGRVFRVRDELEGEETFCVTYGDGLSDVNISALLGFHRSHGKTGTLLAAKPHSQFGILEIDEDDLVREFHEKPPLDHWINGGFFVFNRSFLDYLDDDVVLEKEPLERLASEGELVAFHHTGFWKCLDTYKDYLEMNRLCDEGKDAWRVW
jgi:glucose-1-phosphate cytidylyltransferase